MKVDGESILIFVLLLAGALLTVMVYLLWKDSRRRGKEAGQLQQLVKERTEELAALSSYLQQVSEREKQALARELHDSLGGLLVATKMDIAWLRARLPTQDEDLMLRWRRIQQSLDNGVDLKRRIVEQLRPTLLDNMGLYSALRWQFQESCHRAGLSCTEQLPEIEPRLTSEASIALFRIAQESFINILKHSTATAADLCVTVDADHLVLRVRDNGQGFQPGQKTGAGSGQGLAGIRHRVNALGGKVEIGGWEESGTQVRVKVPFASILETEESEELAV